MPNPTVAKVSGISISGTPSSGQALVATSSTAASWSNPFAASGNYVTRAGGTTSTSESLPFLSVEDFGAKGDVINHVDGVITNASTAFTSNSATFTSADTGKTINVIGAGQYGHTLVATITYVSAHAVTLSIAAQTTVSGASYFYGTDDTTAIQAAITACPDGGTVRFRSAYFISATTNFCQPDRMLSGSMPHCTVTPHQYTVIDCLC